MSDSKSNPDFFERLAESADDTPLRAPAPVKARLYSRMLKHWSSTGPLLSLEACGRLCVFEKAVTLLPVPESVKELNPCSVCHARVLAEHMRQAPIYWSNCPYARFQSRG